MYFKLQLIFQENNILGKCTRALRFHDGSESWGEYAISYLNIY